MGEDMEVVSMPHADAIDDGTAVWWRNPSKFDITMVGRVHMNPDFSSDSEFSGSAYFWLLENWYP